MWRLSDDLQRIVQELNELRESNLLLGRWRRETRIQELLEQLAAAAEPAAVPCAARFLLATNGSIREAAQSAVAKLIRFVAPYDLIQFCDSFARSYGWYVDDRWDKLAPSDVAALAGKSSDKCQSAVLGLLSFHRNGYVRHEAVRRLSKLFDGSELPFLLIRQNDWVAPISRDAQSAIALRVNGTYIRHLAHCLRLILHLASCHRRDQRAVLAHVIELLLDERNDDFLRNTIQFGDRGVRRQVVRHALEKLGNHQARVITYGMATHDAVVRLHCCCHLPIAYGEGLRLRREVDSLLTDYIMPVRREALRIKAQCFPEVAAETWKCALVDPSRSIRELARFSLAKLDPPNSNAAEIYRELLAKQPECLAALEGLAETGDSTDLDYLQGHLEHRLPSRRAAAIRGLIRIGGDVVAPVLLPLLKDDSPSVVRAARAAIGPYRFVVGSGHFLAAALEASHPYARRNAVGLLAELGKWRGTSWLLKVIADADTETAGYAEQRIQEWMTPPKWNTDFTHPSARDSQEIETALLNSRHRMSPSTVDLIEIGLAQFR